MANTSNSWTFKESQNRKRGLLDVVLSWSLSNILNKDLYKFQVKEIPLTFSSTIDYIDSFIYPLLEETHADLLSHVAGISQAPASRISVLQRIPTGKVTDLLYRIIITGTDYEPQVGDLIALTQVKPKCIYDLDRPNSRFIIAYVTKITDQNPITLHVLSSDLIESNNQRETKEPSKTFVVHLTNLTTNMRIWAALNWQGNMNIIRRTLTSSTSPVAGKCNESCREGQKGVIIDLKLRPAFNSFNLDSSQEAAVLSCLASNRCLHQNCIKLIWGPPGTGKTKTMASLLFMLLRKKHRTLTCAPTNVAVVGVAMRILSLVRDHDLGCDTYGFGDIVLFGNQERMKIDDHEELRDVFLDNRIHALSSGLSKWKSYVNGMIQFLENPVKEYDRLIVSPKPNVIKTKSKKKNDKTPQENSEEKQLTFEEFSMNRCNVFGKDVISCLKTLYTHLPTSVVSLAYAKKLYHLINLIQMVGESVKEIVTGNKSLHEAFKDKTVSSFGERKFMKLRLRREECMIALKELHDTSFIPLPMNIDKLKSFCVNSACLIFCTASSSIKLYKNQRPIKLVLIDEAAQLKECESVIPLQLPGAQIAVLVGDERQLPSMVQSKICEEAKFGRSLFERLVLLGHEKHLLNVQYRMDPSISQFPNAEFYNGKILDSHNVTNKGRGYNFLRQGMYGSYLFIDVDCAKEELDNNHSTKNIVEVAVIVDIVANLFKESLATKQIVTVGCISPYKAQVNAIQAKLGNKYNNKQSNGSTFTVNVRSVDGFQGSEEDVIIFSTVRCNKKGSVGFLSNRQRANVALTRARHCLWIVGNKETMVKSGSVWTALVSDAEDRGCVYSASENKNLAQAMVQGMVELAEFGPLLKSDSILFKEAKWKVNFTNTFLERMASIANLCIRKQVVALLVKLSNGWRQLQKTNKKSTRGISDMLETYNLDGHLYLVWSIDIVYENSLCTQVLKVWDILPYSQIQQRANCLERFFGNYTWDKIKRCQTKCFDRNQALPMTWPENLGSDLGRDLVSQLGKLSLSDETRAGWDRSAKAQGRWMDVKR